MALWNTHTGSGGVPDEVEIFVRDDIRLATPDDMARGPGSAVSRFGQTSATRTHAVIRGIAVGGEKVVIVSITARPKYPLGTRDVRPTNGGADTGEMLTGTPENGRHPDGR